MSAESPARLSVHYRAEPADALLANSGTLALFGFGGHAARGNDPRHLRVPLQSLSSTLLRECWQVQAPIVCGEQDDLHWAAGGGWLFAAIDLRESDYGGIEGAAEHAYRTLCGFVGAREERNFLRVWNYLHDINEGTGDEERYRRFCVGRARGLAAHGIDRYPAATAIGHRDEPGLLQIYALCATQPGVSLENPRQVSAWRYPREYGPIPPSFARAMRLPRDNGLAISGTAAVVGHASRHDENLAAQIEETNLNLRALLDAASMSAFNAQSPLKIYLRHAADADAVNAALTSELDPVVPRILLAGDICRRELLVEIDGWQFAS